MSAVSAAKQKTKFPMYKDKPLVRCKNIIYYGDSSDAYIAQMEIKSTKKSQDLDVADEVSIKLFSTDPNLSKQKRLIKASKKPTLYEAIDVADAWLHRALAEQA